MLFMQLKHPTGRLRTVRNLFHDDDLGLLRFRRQFILAPSYCDRFASWKKVKHSAGICLTVHPELSVTQVESNHLKITLLGYIIDPSHPADNDHDILRRLSAGAKTNDSPQQLIRRTKYYSGRWVLIVKSALLHFLFIDPMGLRQVFYTNTDGGVSTWCASQPNLIASCLRLTVDPDAWHHFINTRFYRESKECIWPADTSPYREIKHLLPNHWLDLGNGEVRRFWPAYSLKRMPLAKASARSAALLRKIIDGAFRRFPLSFTITAGWDTRLLLSAAKRWCDSACYFSLLRYPNDPDVLIPARLLARLGLKHNVVSYPRSMDPAFKKIYHLNVTTGHELWGRMAEGIYRTVGQDAVCVRGNALEIARTRFRRSGGSPVDHRYLSTISAFTHGKLMAQSPYVNGSWERWLDGTKDLHNIHLLDLFYWEHYAGNFAAACLAEWDIIHDGFVPFNSRALLEMMLSIDETHRKYAEPIFIRSMIEELWPEVLTEPVNPPRKPLFRDHVKRLRKKTRRIVKARRTATRSKDDE